MKQLGVSEAKMKNGTPYFRSSVTYHNKHISLGSFTKSKNAHLAYWDAKKILTSPLVKIHDYTEKSFLSFEKWVVLINFRDNHIYFATPIYVRPKFFYYYLSPDIELKFDIDDLFYYSSHKIMTRKGHLFVADYGMQVNILNRYGIKNYAVVNRDYRFINEDDTDFRYENIDIINRYYGVQKRIHKGTTTYKVLIHVRGNYVVGTYVTEEEAAIAYNKAVDVLKKSGSQKEYPQNFVEGITNTQYAELYTKLKISPKLYRL